MLFFANSSRVLAQQNNDHYQTMKDDILLLVNKYRAKKHLKPLAINPIITTAAEKHSHNMATGKVEFGHEGFDERMAQIGKQVKPALAWAENVLMGSRTANEAVAQWLNSEGHRHNIEGDYNLTGIGIVKSKSGELYFTQIFWQGGKK